MIKQKVLFSLKKSIIIKQKKSYFFKRKSYFFLRKYYDKKPKYYDIKQVSLIFSKQSDKVPNGIP